MAIVLEGIHSSHPLNLEGSGAHRWPLFWKKYNLLSTSILSTQQILKHTVPVRQD